MVAASLNNYFSHEYCRHPAESYSLLVSRDQFSSILFSEMNHCGSALSKKKLSARLQGNEPGICKSSNQNAPFVSKWLGSVPTENATEPISDQLC